MSSLNHPFDEFENILFLFCIFGRGKDSDPIHPVSLGQTIFCPFLQPKDGIVQDVVTPLVYEIIIRIILTFCFILCIIKNGYAVIHIVIWYVVFHTLNFMSQIHAWVFNRSQLCQFCYQIFILLLS